MQFAREPGKWLAPIQAASMAEEESANEEDEPFAIVSQLQLLMTEQISEAGNLSIRNY